MIFHIFIISCLCSRFHVRNQWFFYSVITFSHIKCFVHSYTVDVVFTLSYWKQIDIESCVIPLFLLILAWRILFWHRFCILTSLTIKIQDCHLRSYWKCNLNVNGHTNPCNITLPTKCGIESPFLASFLYFDESKYQNSRWQPFINSIFSCDQAALQMVFSVCPSVRPSVCLSHLFSCDQAALWMVFSVRLSVCLSVCPSVRLSVCPSVRLSHLFDYVPIIVSSWNFQELSHWTRVRSMQKVKVRGQRSRSERSRPKFSFPDCNSSLNSHMMIKLYI